ALRQAAEPATPVAAVTAPVPALPTHAASGSLDQAIRDLEHRFDRNDDHLDAVSPRSVRTSLPALHRAIADIRAGQRPHPGNPELASYLIATLRRKLDVLRSAVGRESTAL